MAPKKPQDYRRKREPFEFLIDGQAHSLRPPTLNEMKLAAAIDDIDGFLELFGTCGDGALVTAAGDLDLPGVRELFQDWIASNAPDGDTGKSDSSSG